MDHFAALGLPRSFALDPSALERNYLRLSRELHPDRQRAGDESGQAEMLQRAAALNNGYRTLKEPFARAEHLVELIDRDAMARTKNLPADFLMEAMELSERAADCTRCDAQALTTEIRQTLDGYLTDIAAAFAGGQDAATATTVAQLLHRSKYYRKALEDLTETMDE